MPRRVLLAYGPKHATMPSKGAHMDVEWTVAKPGSGWAVPSPTRSDAETYGNRLAQLVEQRWGYSEVWQAGTMYPTLTLSISDDLAVVHRFIDAETCLLLQGEDVVPEDKSHDFPVLDVVVTITGEFISTSARAAAVIDAFAHGADPAVLGSWSRL